MTAAIQVFESEPLWLPLSDETRIRHYLGFSARTIWRLRRHGFPIRSFPTAGGRKTSVVYLREARLWLEKNVPVYAETEEQKKIGAAGTAPIGKARGKL